MIKILFKDGTTVNYKRSEYTDYLYDSKTFVVVQGEQWIGIYNIDALIGVEIKPKKKK